jgi:hypothetical protein
MGGLGSGNRYQWRRLSKKTTVEECLSLDARRWQREGILAAGVRSTRTWRWTYRAGGAFAVSYEVDTQDPARPVVRLSYSWAWVSTKEQESASYPVELTTTKPPHSGVRWWFLCPLVLRGVPCGRRVGKLYLPPLDRYFGCRRCHDLTYRSCQTSSKPSALFRRLAAEAGFDPGRLPRGRFF